MVECAPPLVARVVSQADYSFATGRESDQLI